MEEINEEIQKEKKEEEKNNNVSNFGVTLLFVLLAIVVGFAVLICVQ